jgi:hypothetical protein
MFLKKLLVLVSLISVSAIASPEKVILKGSVGLKQITYEATLDLKRTGETSSKVKYKGKLTLVPNNGEKIEAKIFVTLKKKSDQSLYLSSCIYASGMFGKYLYLLALPVDSEMKIGTNIQFAAQLFEEGWWGHNLQYYRKYLLDEGIASLTVIELK